MKIIIIFIMFILCCLCIYNDKEIGAIIFAIFFIFLILFFYSSNFEIVELLGAKFKIKELKTSINELKELSKVIAEISLYQLQTNMRLGTDVKKQHDFFKKIDKILDNVKISNEEKSKIYEKNWHYWILYDYNNLFSSIVHDEINKTNVIDENKKNELKNLCLTKDYNNTIKAYNEAIIRGVEFSYELKNKMEDLIFYAENREHKDIDRWVKYSRG